MKKVIGIILSLTVALSVVCAVPQSLSNDMQSGITVSAVKSPPLPYQYRELTREEQKIYTQLRNALIDGKRTVKINEKFTITSDQCSKIREIISNGDPYIFNTQRTNCNHSTDRRTGITTHEFTVTYRYNISKATYDKMMAEVDKAADRIIAGFTPNMSAYDKVKFIYDSIGGSVVFDNDTLHSRTPYAALVQRRAKCSGISRAFLYVCQKAGITALIAHNAEHAWNKVRIGGEWFVIDVTYSICSNFRNSVKYENFMISDSDYSHKEGTIIKSPRATVRNRGYYHFKKLRADSVASARTMVANEMLKAVNDNRHTFSIQLTSKAVYDAVRNDLFDKYEMHNIIDGVCARSSVKLANYYRYVEYDESYIIKICIFYPNTPLSRYLKNPDKISQSCRDRLEKFGIK